MPSVIRRFRETAPNVRLVLEESSTGELLEDVSEGRVDVAFIRGAYGPDRGVVVETVLEETMLAAFPADHPAVKGRARKRIALSELADESRSSIAGTAAPVCTTPSSRPAAPPVSARASRRRRRACCRR